MLVFMPHINSFSMRQKEANLHSILHGLLSLVETEYEDFLQGTYNVQMMLYDKYILLWISLQFNVKK